MAYWYVLIACLPAAVQARHTVAVMTADVCTYVTVSCITPYRAPRHAMQSEKVYIFYLSSALALVVEFLPDA